MRIKRKPNQNEIATATKASLSLMLALKADISDRKAKKITQAVVDTMIELLSNERHVIIGGFGILTIKQKSERSGCNPKTREYHLVPDRKVVTLGHLSGAKNRAGIPEMIGMISDKAGIEPQLARVAFDIVTNEIRATTLGRSRVELRGLGVFCFTEHPAKTRRNPKTGEAVHCDAKIFAKFKCSKLLLKTINGGIK